MSSNPEELKPVDDIQDQPIPEDAVAGNADEQAVENVAEETAIARNDVDAAEISGNAMDAEVAEETASDGSGDNDDQDDTGQVEAEAPAEEAGDDSDAEAEAPAEEAGDDSDAEAEAPAEEEAGGDSDAEAEAPAEEAGDDSDAESEAPAEEEAGGDSDAEAEESTEVTQENTTHDVGEEEDVTGTMQWYILKVQVNREDSIRDALVRRIKMHGLEEFFGDVVVPTEDIAEFNRSGKRRIVKKKLFPGYIMVNMIINDDTWFLVRETSGIGDFTGTFGKPTPMSDEEVRRIIQVDDEVEEGEQQVKTAIPFKKGDRVRVKDGNFQNFEGEVDNIDEASGRVTIIVSIFGRSTPVELEHWQIEEV